jgi:tRNA(Ile)-lysidine synthase
MQLSKGAGVKELIAMEEFEKRDFYTIWRPFAFTTREEIEEFLEKNDIKYFIDESNFDTKFKRNFIRKHFSNEFLKIYSKGVKKSFEFLEEDKKLLIDTNWKRFKNLFVFDKKSPAFDIKKVDLILKKLGVLPTKAQKDEILRTNFSCVIQGKIAIDSNSDKVFIAPYVKIPLKNKEFLRKNKIPPKVRGYVQKENLCHTLSTEMSTDALKNGKN